MPLHPAFAWIPRLSLTAKLTAINVLQALSLLAVVAVAWQMLPAETEAGEDVVRLGRALRASQTADMLHDALHADVLSALLVEQLPGGRHDEVRAATREDAAGFRSALGTLESGALTPELNQLAGQARVAALAYVEQAERTITLAFVERRSALAETVAFKATFETAKTALAKLSDALAKASERAHAQSRQAAAKAQRWLGLAAALSIVFGWSCVALIARSIRRSLASLGQVARDIADGQLDRRHHVTGRDEVGTLARSVNQMADRLRDMIEHMRQDAEQGAFSAGLVEALDMADSEAQAQTVVARAMAQVAPDHAMELLISDASQAHLERAAEHPRAGAPGCGVETAFGCVAVRRGHALQFAHSDALNACPHLRDRRSGAISAACVPVTFMGRALGVLHASGPADQALTPLQFGRLSTLGAQTGARIGTVRAFERTQVQASTDSLTGLANRRTLEARIRALVQARRPYVLLMCDLDHFKRLNDTFGHPAGDDALRTFSEVVRACAREQDILARWGGEEFAFVLHDATGADAVAWAARVRARLADTLRTRSKPLFTASFGVAESSCAPTQELLVRHADDALYRAKAEGRDRAVLFDAEQDAQDPPKRHASEQHAAVDLPMLVNHD